MQDQATYGRLQIEVLDPSRPGAYLENEILWPLAGCSGQAQESVKRCLG